MFRNLSIDDVVDNPIARAEVTDMWRIYSLITRRYAAMDEQRRRERGWTL